MNLCLGPCMQPGCFCCCLGGAACYSVLGGHSAGIVPSVFCAVGARARACPPPQVRRFPPRPPLCSRQRCRAPGACGSPLMSTTCRSRAPRAASPPSSWGCVSKTAPSASPSPLSLPFIVWVAVARRGLLSSGSVGFLDLASQRPCGGRVLQGEISVCDGRGRRAWAPLLARAPCLWPSGCTTRPGCL